MSEAAEGVTERPGAASAVDLSARPIRFLWLEITGKCQLECVHCYADSGPDGDHGTMSTADWLHVLNQARELGIRAVQFIGGEPSRRLHT
jgi:MoaA/NifB/PqqE/SkfB family radical SAM enzyme